MSDLERRREAKDLWISRGHILSAGVGVSLLLVVAFAVGYRTGSAENNEREREPSLEVVEHDRQLQELLERLDALKDPTAVDALTFPDLKKGSDAEHIEAPAVATEEPSITISMSDHAVPGDLSDRVGAPPAGLHLEWLRSSDVELIRRSLLSLASADIEATLVMEKGADETVYSLVSTPCRTKSDCAEWKREHRELILGFEQFTIRSSPRGSE